jgi:hypothetical protein
MVLRCADLQLRTPCCPTCTDSSRTTIYPKSFDGRPDLGMGIRGLICCFHIHDAQDVPRRWWHESYLRRTNRFLESEIQRALHSTRETYYRIDGEIHAAARQREESKTTKKVVIKVGQKTCPECGSKWNETVCDNCGYIQ